MSTTTTTILGWALLAGGLALCGLILYLILSDDNRGPRPPSDEDVLSAKDAAEVERLTAPLAKPRIGLQPEEPAAPAPPAASPVSAPWPARQTPTDLQAAYEDTMPPWPWRLPPEPGLSSHYYLYAEQGVNRVRPEPEILREADLKLAMQWQAEHAGQVATRPENTEEFNRAFDSLIVGYDRSEDTQAWQLRAGTEYRTAEDTERIARGVAA